MSKIGENSNNVAVATRPSATNNINSNGFIASAGSNVKPPQTPSVTFGKAENPTVANFKNTLQSKAVQNALQEILGGIDGYYEKDQEAVSGKEQKLEELQFKIDELDKQINKLKEANPSDPQIAPLEEQKAALQKEYKTLADEYFGIQNRVTKDLNDYYNANPEGIPGIKQIRGTSPNATKLVNAAMKAAKRNTFGYCYGAVSEAVLAAMGGAKLTGNSAFMAMEDKPNMLPRRKDFKEIRVNSANDLRGLPPGCIVVWPKGPRSPHGHISVSLGGGREASDHVAAQITSYRGVTSGFKVFAPADMTINA